MRAPYLICLILLSPAPAAAGGFGKLAWGTSFKQARKQHPGLRAYSGGPVADERAALKQIAREAAKRSKKRSLRPSKPRITAGRYVLKLEGLRAEVELQYFGGRLYGAVVRMLYTREQKASAAKILDLLAEKYGTPVVDVGQRLEFDTEDGRLVVHIRPAKTRRGMLRLAYTAKLLGKRAHGYLGDLRFRAGSAERKKAAARAEAKAAKARRTLDHL